MAGEVYISGIFQNYELGDKPGVRTKFLGEEWEPAQFEIPPTPKHAQAAYQAHAKGQKIEHAQFPEGMAVWNEKAFAKMKDFLWAGPFLTVKQKVADVLSRFDLGGGELVPVPLLKADLVTSWPEPYYYINYGGPKDTLVPEASRDVRVLATDPGSGEKHYKVPSGFKDGDIALSMEARLGADIWVEKYIYSKLFLSGALVDALLAAKIDVDLRLAKCRIVGG